MDIENSCQNRQITTASTIMKILYITTDDILRNSSANIRNASLVRGLKDIGHGIEVLCLKYNKQDAHLKTILEGINITYLFGQESSHHEVRQTGIKKILKPYAVKLYNAVRTYDPLAHLVRKVKKEVLSFDMPDVIISSSDPRSSHLFAEKVIKLLNFQGKYIQYWGDPMMNDISASLIMRPFLRMAERRLLKLADLAVYTNDATVLQMHQTYGIPLKKMTSIPTPCATTALTCSEVDSTPSTKQNIKIGYFGEYNSKRRDIMPLIKAVISDSQLSLTIAGATDIQLPKEQNITCFPHLGAAEVAKLQEEVDILIVLENKPKNKALKNKVIQIPGKVFHYGITNKKILIIEETGLSKSALEKYNRYYFCDNNISDIATMLKHIATDNDPKKCQPTLEFTPKHVAMQLTEKINNI